jgi:hypothetical protein
MGERLDQLKEYVHKTAHAELIRRRQDWFEKFEAAYTALWWVPAGHIPGIDEAKKRLAHLQEHGPMSFAFTFRQLFPPDEQVAASTDWGAFVPCPA